MLDHLKKKLDHNEKFRDVVVVPEDIPNSHARLKPGSASKSLCKTSFTMISSSQADSPNEEVFAIRVLSFLPGKLIGNIVAQVLKSSAVLNGIGRALASIDVCLLDFDHPAAHRSLKWSMQVSPLSAC